MKLDSGWYWTEEQLFSHCDWSCVGICSGQVNESASVCMCQRDKMCGRALAHVRRLNPFFFFFLVTISVFHLNPMLQINQQITCFPFVSLVWHIGQKSGKQICRCFVLEIKTRTLTSTSVSWNVYRTNITRLLSKLCMFYRILNKINKFPKWCLGKCYLIPFST